MRDARRAGTWSLDRGLAGAATGAVLALSVAACVRKVWAADFWWQHAGGRWIAEHGWPTLDVFSYTARDRPWMELRWLFCVAQYRIEAWAGTGGLIALKWMAVVAAFALVSLPVSRGRARLTVAAVLTVALLASSQRFFVRPELVSYLFIGVFVWVLARYRDAGGRRSLLALPLLQVLWVNSHPLFIFGPLLIGLMLTVTLAGPLFGRRTEVAGPGRARDLAVVLVAAALACLINPYGLQGALHPFLLFSEMRASVFSETISELRSPFTFGSTYSAVFWYKVLIGLCAASAVINLRRLDPFWTIFCVSQFYLSTLSIRNLPFFCLAAVPFVVSNLDRSALLDAWRQRAVVPAVRRGVATLVIGVCVFYAWRMATDRMSVRQNDSNQFGVGFAAHRFPEKSADFILRQGTGGHVYATLLESAYLLSRGVAVFADPRLEVYGEALFSRYLAAQSGASAWREAVEQYDIRTALVDLRSGLCRFLLHAPDWRLAYFDSVAAVFVRADQPVNAIETPEDFAVALRALRDELPHPRPYAAAGLFERVTIPRPYLALADFLIAAGRTQEAGVWLEDARAAGPFLPGLTERRLHLAESAGDWSAVVRLAGEALAESPGDPGLMVRLGEAHYRLSESRQASEWLTRSLSGLPDRALTWSTLGRIALERQDLVEAERCFERAVELAPQEAVYHSSLGRVLILAGRRAEAIAALRRALDLDPNNLSVIRDLAQLNALEGAHAAASRLVARGLQLDPASPELLDLKARLGY